MNDEQTLRRIGSESLMELVREHKKKCKGHCNISFVILRLWLESYGISFSEEEQKELI
jgi:hypothetical protein